MKLTFFIVLFFVCSSGWAKIQELACSRVHREGAELVRRAAGQHSIEVLLPQSLVAGFRSSVQGGKISREPLRAAEAETYKLPIWAWMAGEYGRLHYEGSSQQARAFNKKFPNIARAAFGYGFIAREEAKKQFPSDSEAQDTYRHALASAYMARFLGAPAAQCILANHEATSEFLTQPGANRFMSLTEEKRNSHMRDFLNNFIGIAIGLEAQELSREQLRSRVLKRLQAGIFFNKDLRQL